MKFPLRVLTVGYLLLPNILFVLGWFRYSYSIPIIIGFAYLFIFQMRNISQLSEIVFPLKDLLILFSGAVFWTFCTGTSGLSFQIADYWAHNAKFYDLYKNSWPIYFTEKGQYACYYFGYFIVPAFISKLLGHLSPATIFIWTTIGYWLGLSWLYVLLKQKKRLILIFLFIGGIGHLAKVMFYQFTNYEFHIAPFYMEIWAIYDQSLWVTNQVVPIILISSLFIYDAFFRKSFEDSFFPITLGFLWAIFPSIIFVVLFAILFLHKYVRNRYLLFTKSTFHRLIIPGLIFIPTFIYFLSSDSMPVSGFLWQFGSVSEITMEYFTGTILDIVLLFLLTKMFRTKDSLIPEWFINAVFILFIVMSLYRIGRWNDWFIRGYIPLLFMISVPLLRNFYDFWIGKSWNKSLYFNVLLVFFSLSLIIPVGHVFRSLQKNVIINRLLPGRWPFEPLPYDTYSNTYEAVTEKSSDGELESRQYLAKKNSFYEKYLSHKIR